VVRIDERAVEIEQEGLKLHPPTLLAARRPRQRLDHHPERRYNLREMIVPDRKMSWFRLLFSLRGTTLVRIRGRLTAVFVVAVLATVLHARGISYDLTVIPFTLISLALGVFLGFRNNTAYERYWEARRLWGKLVNDARIFARLVLTQLSLDVRAESRVTASELAALQRELVYGMVAFVHALRFHLRGELHLLDSLDGLLPASALEGLAKQHNVPNALVLRLGQRIAEARRLGVVRHRDVHLFEQQLTSMSDVQGGCERIRNTPMPYSYTVLIHSIVATYCFALPFGIVATTKLVTPVVVVLIAYAFLGLDAVGDEIEEPFGRDYNDLPLTTLSRMIEVNLRQMLGESELPELLGPDSEGVLH
jgi:putative membrane protein